VKLDLGNLARHFVRKNKPARRNTRPVPEFDLEAPIMVPKACVIRSVVDRMIPGQMIILRSSDLEVPWEMEHLCNRLGHELMKVEREGSTCWFTLRVRGDEDRQPLQDPSRLALTPQTPVRTIDISHDGDSKLEIRK